MNLSFRRRLNFATVVLVAQLLLIGTTTGWLVFMFFYRKVGRILCMETNSVVLYGEIVLISFIILFAGIVFIPQWKRVGERRVDDRGKNLHARDSSRPDAKA